MITILFYKIIYLKFLNFLKEFKLTINASCNFTSNACQDFAGLGSFINIFKAVLA
jgi:hypothetical protein